MLLALSVALNLSVAFSALTVVYLFVANWRAISRSAGRLTTGILLAAAGMMIDQTRWLAIRLFEASGNEPMMRFVLDTASIYMMLISGPLVIVGYYNHVSPVLSASLGGYGRVVYWLSIGSIVTTTIIVTYIATSRI